MLVQFPVFNEEAMYIVLQIVKNNFLEILLPILMLNLLDVTIQVLLAFVFVM